ncbi:hypothetical protein QUC31_017345 [Theobroma cacao]
MEPKLSHQVYGAIFLFLVLQPLVVKSRTLKPEFLRNTERAQKGGTLNGLNQVKKYLKAFGYYPNNDNVDIFKDLFNDFLESALKSYQQNYNLKVTSKIDPDTIKAMMIPRCGVTDIIPNLPSNATGETYQLTYSFLSDVQGVSSQIIARAFQKREAVSSFRLYSIKQGAQADVRIHSFRNDHGDGIPIGSPRNIFAYAFAPQDGTFQYNADKNWSTNPTAPNEVDLESVAVHEMGHIPGLGHSQDEAAIMFPIIPMGTTKRNRGQVGC